MTESLIIGGAIVLGFALHAWVVRRSLQGLSGALQRPGAPESAPESAQGVTEPLEAAETLDLSQVKVRAFAPNLPGPNPSQCDCHGRDFAEGEPTYWLPQGRGFRVLCSDFIKGAVSAS